MTRLDKAFIKAYSKTTPRQTLVADAPGSPGPTATEPAPAEAFPLAPVAEAIIAAPQAGVYERLDCQHITHAPHWNVPQGSGPQGISAFGHWDGTPEAIVVDAATPEPATLEPAPPEPAAVEEVAVEDVAIEAPPQIIEEPVVARSLQVEQPAAELLCEATAPPTPEPTQASPVVVPPEPALNSIVDNQTVNESAVNDAAVNDEFEISNLKSQMEVIEQQTPEVEVPPPAIHRAAFEVDSFLWPEMCRKLTSAGTLSWNGLAGELTESAAEGQKIVVITSHHRGEGRTTLALCLAKLLAKRQVRVALVDADFQRPQLASQLKLLPACGWDEVARGEQALTESWIESLADGATLAPLRPRPDSRGLTGNARVAATLALLRQQHELVIVDAGALEDADDRELLALLGGTALVDCALVVRDVRSGSAETLAACQKRLDTLGIARWDVVENFV